MFVLLKCGKWRHFFPFICNSAVKSQFSMWNHLTPSSPHLLSPPQAPSLVCYPETWFEYVLERIPDKNSLFFWKGGPETQRRWRGECQTVLSFPLFLWDEARGCADWIARLSDKVACGKSVTPSGTHDGLHGWIETCVRTWLNSEKSKKEREKTVVLI